MATLPLTYFPTATLREPSDRLTVFDADLKKLVADMADTMKANKGIGLAAPQVGKNIQLTIINTENGILPLVNPRIYFKSFRKNWDEEGCLSIPQVFGQVKRANKVTVRAQDINGKKIVVRGNGLLARVMLHEIDHLRGALFIEKAKDLNGEGAMWEAVKKDRKL